MASEADLPLYPMLGCCFFCFILPFLLQLLVASLSFPEVLICCVGVLQQGWNRKLGVLEEVVCCLRAALRFNSVFPFLAQGHSGCVNCLEWNEKGE